jgi:membrane associated rhomboid family serine protease
MLFPIGDDNRPGHSAPIINYTLIGMNILVFIYELSLGNQLDLFIGSYSVIPFEITHGVDLVGRYAVPGIRGGIIEGPGPHPIYLTLLTSMFMHGGWAHVGFNMLYLWVFGDNVEDAFGHVKYLIFYLVCGLAAGFAQIAMAPDSLVPSLGASGAIAGVLGAYIVMFPQNRIRTLVVYIFITIVRLPALLVIGIWIVMQLFSQLASISDATAQTGGGGVAYMAHIGGFFAGLILTLFLRPRRERDEPYEHYDPY